MALEVAEDLAAPRAPHEQQACTSPSSCSSDTSATDAHYMDITSLMIIIILMVVMVMAAILAYAKSVAKPSKESTMIPGIGPDISLQSIPTPYEDSGQNNSMIDPVIFFESLSSTGEEILDRAEALYEGFKSAGIDTTTLESIPATARNIVQESFPAVLDVAKTVPLVGAVAGVALSFYRLHGQWTENRETINELSDLIRDTLRLLGSMDRRLQQQIATDASMAIVAEHMRVVIRGIDEATACLTAYEKQNIGLKALLVHECNSKMRNLILSIEKARNTMIAHLTILKSSDDKLLAAFPTAYIDFGSDISTHLQRFVDGSRSWITQVR